MTQPSDKNTHNSTSSPQSDVMYYCYVELTNLAANHNLPLTQDFTQLFISLVFLTAINSTDQDRELTIETSIIFVFPLKFVTLIKQVSVRFRL